MSDKWNFDRIFSTFQIRQYYSEYTSNCAFRRIVILFSFVDEKKKKIGEVFELLA